MKPKLWQGPSAIGQAHSRALNNLPSRVGTSYGFETLDNGQLGTTMSKKCGDYNEVYRYGGQEDPKYFLCTWQETVVTMLSRITQRKDVRFVSVPRNPRDQNEYVGNCAYVGDGFVAGILPEQTHEGYGLPHIALMRMPVPGALVTGAEYQKLDERKKLAVSVKIEFPEGTQRIYSRQAYIVPMGWKDKSDRYVFALVIKGTHSYDPPAMWIGSTGSMSLSKCPESLGVDWRFSARFVGAASLVTDVTCTAPGVLEMVVRCADDSVPVSNEVWEMVPAVYRYQVTTNDTEGVFDMPPWSATPPGWPVYHPSPYYTDPFGKIDYVDAGSSIPSYVLRFYSEYGPIPPAMFLVRSSDFGKSWSVSEAPELDDAWTLPPGNAMYDSVLRPAPSQDAWFFPDSSPGRGLHGIWRPTVRARGIIVPYNDGGGPTYKIVNGPPVLEVPHPNSDRGLRTHPADISESAGGVLVGAGSTTFLTAPGFLRMAEWIVPVSWVMWEARQFVHPEHSTGEWYSEGPPGVAEYPVFARLMYVRKNGGAFTRVAWPGDDFITSRPDPVYGILDKTPSHTPVNSTLSDLAFGGTAQTWVSAGEGCAAFFFARASGNDNELVTAIATVDGGETWNTRVIENSANMSQVCLLAGDAREPCAILFAAIDPETYQTQLYRMTADLSEVKRYGPPYPDPWRRGLTNFKDYVHPGFPGVYDGPDTQPRKPA